VLNKIKLTSKKKIDKEKLLMQNSKNLVSPWSKIARELITKQSKKKSKRIEKCKQLLKQEENKMRMQLQQLRQKKRKKNRLSKTIILFLEKLLRKILMRLTNHLNNKMKSSRKIEQNNQILLHFKHKLMPKRQPKMLQLRSRRMMLKLLRI
jgi:hypothetical protein